MRNKLVERKYRRRIVDSAVDRVRQLDRSDVLGRVVREDNSVQRV